MFKLLIADDEAGSREWLAQEIPWENHDICLVGPAVDGLEAWRMFQEENPELILTDIRMPGINGIELARAALAVNPHTRILVISGYDEFAYAKNCLEIGVSGYLLKPSPKDEILAAVLKEREFLIAKRADEAVRHFLQAQLEKNIPVLRDQWLRDLLRGEIDSANLAERLCFLNLPLKTRQLFITLLLEVEDNTGLYLNYDEKERQLIWLAMDNLARASLKNSGLAVRLDRSGVGILLYNETGRAPQEFEEFAKRTARSLLDQSRLQLSCALMVGIGGTVDEITQVWRSFEQAKRALRFHSQLGVETIVIHDGCYPGEKAAPLFLPADEERLSASLETAAFPETVRSILHDLYGDEIAARNDAPASDWRRETGWVLTGVLVRLAQRAALILREIIEGEDYALLMQGGPNSPAHEIVRWWESQFGRLGHAGRKLHGNSLRACIRHVQEYVDSHIAETITLSKTADQVYMSPSYLSRLFREQTGESFSEYVSRRKMEEARRLLEAGGKKVYEVAMAVGYADPAYFGRVFRQYFNVTPTDYRK